MREPTKAVFLSYASQDAPAVERIAEALRASGVEVWFDKNELVGGDAWDQKIRRQIKECALFVPVISANTQARAEGYFRLEWKLAVDRSHLMADDAPFLFPVVIDETSDAAARVPDKFRDVQWTRLNVKDTPETLAKRVTKLLVGGPAPAVETGRARPAESSEGVAASGKSGPHWIRVVSIIGGLAIGLVYAFRPMWTPPRRAETKSPAAVATAPSPVPPAAPLSDARQLAYKARALVDKIDSTPDDFAAAEGLLKRALELEQTDGEIWAISSRINTAYLSRAFDRSPSRREAGRTQAERAIKLAPDSVEALLALGRSIGRSDFTRTEALLQRALVLAPEDGRVLLALGSNSVTQQKLDVALGYFQRMANVPEWRPLGLYNEFLVFLYQRRFAEAEPAIRDAVADVPSTNFVVGQAMLEVIWHGRADEAARLLAAAPPAVRTEPRTALVTALVAQMNRKPDEALRALDRLPADYINDAWFTGPKGLLAGLAHAQANRPEAARLAWEAGLVVVRRRLQDDPNDPEQHLRLGELLAWSGQTEAAMREAKIVEELAGSRMRVWTASLVRIYAALGRADLAVPLLKQELEVAYATRWPLTVALLRLDPLWDKIRDDPRFQALCVEPAEKIEAKLLSEGAQLAARALALIVKVGFTRDDLAPAEDLARRATEKDPDSAAAWGVRAGIQSAWLFRNWDMSEKRKQDTQAFANRALALDPNEPEALLALGHLLRTQGAFDQAEAHLRRATTNNPNHIRLARALGYTLSGHGRVEEARVVLLAAAKRAPRDPLLRYELAMTYTTYGNGGAKLENLDRAIEQLDIAVAIQPFSSALILKAGLIGGWRSDLPAMRATLDQLEKLPLAERSEDRSVFVAMWAAMLEHRPDRIEAAAALTARNYFDDSVMPLRPKSWSLALAHRLAGKDNLARNDWQAAETVLRQRLQDDPANEKYQVELAITLAWLDQREEAARIVAPIEPVWKEEFRYWRPALLARYYAALGDTAKAMPYLAQEIDQNLFTTRKVIPLDPWWDKLRGQAEFEALLKEPKK